MKWVHLAADSMILRATAAVMAAVAVFAAVVSYSHIYWLGYTHGQQGTDGRLLPLSVDGLILAASLVMLHEARSGRRPGLLAWGMLGLGVAATVGANVEYGLRYGVLGAIISAWPALAFIGTVEMVMGMIRRTRGTPVPAQVPSVSLVPDELPDEAQLFAEDLAGGKVPGVRKIRRVLACGQPRAQEVRAQLEALLAG